MIPECDFPICQCPQTDIDPGCPRVKRYTAAGTIKVTAGTKHDTDKIPVHLLPFDALESIAEILKFGAAKYGDRNWEKGIDWSRVFRACLSHLWQWYMRRGNDPETGKSHLWHAGCCILFLIAYELRGVGQDDRPETMRGEAS